LGQIISVVDKALKRLNLGLSAWVQISGADHTPEDNDRWWSRSLGYGKVGDKWGISLRTLDGNHREPDCESGETWLFAEAPRWMRLEAIGKIPELLERLLDQTVETTKAIKKKTEQAYEIAEAIHELAAESGAGGQK
jgi:hypothetical protein